MIRIFISKIYLFFIANFIFTSNCFSQEKINHLYFSVSPLAIIDEFSGPSLRTGIEYKFGNWGIYAEYGYFLSGFTSVDKDSDSRTDLDLTFEPNYNILNAKGNAIKLLFKKYVHSYKNERTYFGIELFHKNQSYSGTNIIRIDGVSNISNSRSYDVFKNISALTFKLGVVYEYNFGLILEFHGGLGARYRDVENTLTSEENNNIEINLDRFGANPNKAGEFITFNFSLGVKVGYKLW